MTRRPHLKARVRARMAKTGERYAAAREQVIGAVSPSAEPALSAEPAASSAEPASSAEAAPPSASGIRHFPGVHPESTALRILATHAGVRGPDGAPLSEPLAFVVGGGVGIGVFAFVYQKDDFASFFVGGGHRWDDSVGFLDRAARRLGLEPRVEESGGTRQAALNLAEMTATGAPVVAWVDLGVLGTRAYPAEWSGGGYHVLVVYGRDESTGAWLVGDLAPDPLAIPADALAGARARIAKQRSRLMSVTHARDGHGVAVGLPAAVASGLRATVDGLRNPRSRNFGLAALADWADRLDGAGRDSWARAFPRGGRLWNGLTFLHQFVECHGTGGGLLRPLFAAGLREAADLTGTGGLGDVADRYAALGTGWTDLAQAALPDAVPLLREAREIQTANARRYRERGGASLDENRLATARLGAIRATVSADFPLAESDVADLRADLGRRVRAIHAAEVAALAELASVVGASA